MPYRTYKINITVSQALHMLLNTASAVCKIPAKLCDEYEDPSPH